MVQQGRERPAQPIALPASLGRLVKDHVWSRDMVGEAGSAVYRLQPASDGADLYLKHGCGAFADDVVDEMVRLRWIGQHLHEAVPAVLHFVASPGDAWLLMTAVAGRTAYQLLEDEPDRRTAVVDSLAHFLRGFHAVPREQCPFNSSHLLRLARAARSRAHRLDERKLRFHLLLDECF